MRIKLCITGGPVGIHHDWTRLVRGDLIRPGNKIDHIMLLFREHLRRGCRAGRYRRQRFCRPDRLSGRLGRFGRCACGYNVLAGLSKRGLAANWTG
jgi:hypothetical protein